MIVTREDFNEVVSNGFAGIGFPPEAASVIFPTAMFVPGSDLTPVEKNIDKIIEGFTKWEPKTKEKGVVMPTKVRVQGKDYQEVVDNMNLLFLRNLWSDGLPIQPATEERVNWLLTGTDLSPDRIIGKILPKNGIVTVGTIAIGAAMAGARPEYMPVIIGALKAMLDPLFYHQGFQTTTNSAYPIVIVNGPIAKQIRLNSDYGCLGPDPRHPAGATIGRAIRLIQMNLGGAIPGIGSMSIYGGPAKYTNIVFAEDEDGLPPDWEPLSVERGFPRGSNIVTLLPVNSTINASGGIPLTKEKALAILNAYAGWILTPNANYFFRGYTPTGSPGVILMARGTAKGLSDLGWSKEKVRTYLWENSKFPETYWVKSDQLKDYLAENVKGGFIEEKYVQWPMPVCVSPENIIIVVAGGAHSGHGYYFTSYGPAVVSKEINLPRNFEKLLKKAEEDLGCPTCNI